MSKPKLLTEIKSKAPNFSNTLEVAESTSITEEQLKSGLVVIAYPSSPITITIPDITSNNYTEMEIISYGTDGIYLSGNIKILWEYLSSTNLFSVPSGSAVSLKWMGDFWVIIGNYKEQNN